MHWGDEHVLVSFLSFRELFVIEVSSPRSAGIGGGGFVTVRIPAPEGNGTSEAYTIDFRETAPAAAKDTMYVGRANDARLGGLSVGVPGELRGLEELHRRWGTRPWKELVMPSVELAKGWKVSKELERRIEMFSLMMHNSPDWKEIFAPKGCLLREGELIRRTALSRTLATIAEEGPDAFYSVSNSLLKRMYAVLSQYLFIGTNCGSFGRKDPGYWRDNDSPGPCRL